MANVVMYIPFRLVEGASVPDFLLAAQRLHDGYLSKQKGYIEWKQLSEGDMWADLVIWETMEDAKKILEPDPPNALADAFYAFIDPENCEVHLFTVEKSYGSGK